MSSAPKEEIVEDEEIFKIPYGAIPITLNEEGFLIEATINDVAATILLQARLVKEALDSTFVFSNFDSLKMKMTKKRKMVCRGGTCKMKMVSIVTSPILIKFGNDYKMIDKEVKKRYV
jgi:hypothetical protein